MTRLTRRTLIVAAAVFVALFPLAVTPLRAQTAPQVTIDSGKLEGVNSDGLHVFKGIPYAAPPIGELRWRAPQPVKKWAGVRKAHNYGHDAPQKLSGNQDEDCLFLNVWAPADASARPYPVMVWIHGGGFIQGSGKINGESFANRGIVFVSINYRLGRFGAFAHPALLKSLPNGEPPANFWLQDQVAALQWVQRNIVQFGGDPNRVTIFGVSAGGTSVNLLMTSPLAKGLFQRAIAQSGIGGYGPYRRLRDEHRGREPLTVLGERYAKSQGVSDKADVAAALRALPWSTVAKGGTEEDGGGFEIVVDGVSLLDDPQIIFEQGRQNRVPFIGGCNSFEGNLSLVLPWTDQPPKAEVEKRLDKLAPLYGRKPNDSALWADLYGDVFFRASTLHLVGSMEPTSTPAWTYYFDYVRGRVKNSRGAGHGSEVGFVFDNLILPGTADREMSRAMQGHWIQFAKTGDPNGSGLPAWPGYSSKEPMTLVYGQDGITATRDLHKARFDLLFEAMNATWSNGSSAVTASDSSKPTPTGSAPKLSAEYEKALRERVSVLFEALRTGDIAKCVELSDPAVVAAKGKDVAEKFFKSVSGLIKFAKVKAEDRTIKSIAVSDDGRSARVTIEVKLNGKTQPPSIEVWGLVDGKWYYRETTK
ncbi:Para-nitrobenzyl esterase [Planctopirus ephydatiae]|uniref:Carboxylic ester hydrolase n=1 Tax=Planctopirus ephydatiae TaxID=2528019 RepID=A0A518GMH6_9PLAN|nr:carboxylesterase family protein [Planctopirus ephydatiae]QDV29843.1 Para-nitrobenzyl esterase [Planctopirus ephydatiae]QDV30095.1 Para-nitrobenzyl esterase [Planctopirus ephydatiae]